MDFIYNCELNSIFKGLEAETNHQFSNFCLGSNISFLNIDTTANIKSQDLWMVFHGGINHCLPREII